MPQAELTDKKREILEFIEEQTGSRGYPPSVREIGDAVGLSSSSTVHAHLSWLETHGYLHRDPTKPRAIELSSDSATGTTAERRPSRHIPLVGEVAAGTDVLAQENIDELLPMPEDFTGDGELFMLQVRGDSMIDAGILDGDYVVVVRTTELRKGDIVVAGIPGDEATIKELGRKSNPVVLIPYNPSLAPMEFDNDEVTFYGKVVTLLRRI